MGHKTLNYLYYINSLWRELCRGTVSCNSTSSPLYVTLHRHHYSGRHRSHRTKSVGLYHPTQRTHIQLNMNSEVRVHQTSTIHRYWSRIMVKSKKVGKTLAHTKEETPLLPLSGNLQENLQTSPCQPFSRGTRRRRHRSVRGTSILQMVLSSPR